MVVSVERDKRRLLLVLGNQGDLMITLKSIKKAHSRVPICGIYQLINFWHRKRVLRTCSVKVGKVNIDPPFSILLFYHYNIYKPPREKYLLYSSGFLQFLNLLPDGFNMLLS